MEKKNIDWKNLGFGYMQTDYRYVSNFKEGKWGELLYLYTPQEIRSTSEYVSISIANVLPMHKTSRF